MPGVRIYRGGGVDEERLRELLEEAGCADFVEVDDAEEEAAVLTDAFASEPVEGEPEEGGSCDEGSDEIDPDVLIVVLTPELNADPGLEGSLRKAVSEGCNIVGIWPIGTCAGAAPSGFKKYSSDQVIWGSDAVRKAIFGGVEEPAYQAPDGAPQQAVKTPRNCC